MPNYIIIYIIVSITLVLWTVFLIYWTHQVNNFQKFLRDREQSFIITRNNVIDRLNKARALTRKALDHTRQAYQIVEAEMPVETREHIIMTLFDRARKNLKVVHNVLEKKQ